MKSLRFATLGLALALGFAGSLLTAPVTADRAEAQAVFNVDPRFAWPVVGTIAGGTIAYAVCNAPCAAAYIANGAAIGLGSGFVLNELFGRPLFLTYAQAVYEGPPPRKRKRK